MSHLFLFWLAVILIIFQNCSEFERTGSGSVLQFSGPVPENLANRSISLDNKDFEGGSQWLVGGDDIFYYETNHRATFESTLVTVEGRSGIPFMIVEADACRGEKQLTTTEARSVSRFLRENINSTIQNTVADPTTLTAGCAFPRFIVDSHSIFEPTGNPSVDYEIYFSPANCTPADELYVTDINDHDVEAARTAIAGFFNNLIDQICGF